MATPVISKIKLPSNTEYEIRDNDAQGRIASLEAVIGTATGAKALVFKGVSSTVLTDGGTENPTVDSTEITAKAGGDIYFYGSSEFIWGVDDQWHELGNLSGLGTLAYKDAGSVTIQPAGSVASITYQPAGSISSIIYTPAGSISTSYQPAGSVGTPVFTGTTTTISVSANYQPAGSVSFTTSAKALEISTSASGTKSYQPAGSVGAPTISISAAGSTTSIKNPTSKTVAATVAVAAPGATAPANNLTYYSVTSETLSLYQIGYTTTDSISTSNVTVKTGDASYSANAPSFTGTTVHLVADSFNLPTGASFTGTTSTISMSTDYQPAGSNGAISFTGTTATISATLTGTTTTLSPSFTGTTTTFNPSFTGTTTTVAVTFTNNT